MNNIKNKLPNFDKMMILVIDGCAPEYLTKETAPDIFEIAEKCGFIKTVKSEMPSVTNVNHACILSGRLPSETKVVGNYYYHPQTGEEGFIEERGFMKAPTILQVYKSHKKKTALLTVKGKVLGVYGEGADIGISAQNPDAGLLEELGLKTPPAINSPFSTEWILKAALACIEKHSPDLVYCTNNDFIFHHYAPGSDEANQQISFVNEYIRRIHELEPDRRIYITADHGMNQKYDLINFQHIADNQGLHLFCLPPLKDRYIENHIYQEGGILYLFLKDANEKEAILDLISKTPEIEKVMTAHEAAQTYGLPENEIGDYVVFAAKGCAFGEVEGERLRTNDVRTHGSLYERKIPLIGINPVASADYFHYNKDITAVTLGIH